MRTMIIAPLVAAAFSALLSTAALADNDAALKAGSGAVLMCDRLALARERQPNQPARGFLVDQLHTFVDCILNTPTPEDDLQLAMEQVARYYIAVVKYGGNPRPHDYGTVGASGMRYLMRFGPDGLSDLNAKGYPPERLCQIFSWIDCAKLKALPGAPHAQPAVPKETARPETKPEVQPSPEACYQAALDVLDANTREFSTNPYSTAMLRQAMAAEDRACAY
jgi:hypothetical protein